MLHVVVGRLYQAGRKYALIYKQVTSVLLIEFNLLRGTGWRKRFGGAVHSSILRQEENIIIIR